MKRLVGSGWSFCFPQRGELHLDGKQAAGYQNAFHPLKDLLPVAGYPPFAYDPIGNKSKNIVQLSGGGACLFLSTQGPVVGYGGRALDTGAPLCRIKPVNNDGLYHYPSLLHSPCRFRFAMRQTKTKKFLFGYHVS